MIANSYICDPELRPLKKLTSFLLKYIPRPVLQRISHYFLKVFAVLLKGDRVHCPVCEKNFKKFLPYGRVARENALCPNCLSLERHRLIWLYLKRETLFFNAEAKMLHIAPEHCFISRFEAIDTMEYVTGDIESPLAKVKMDIHEIPFDDNEFDIVFCNHVMEHVRDDQLAMSEIHRVLKSGGWGILQITLFRPLPDKTLEDPSVVDSREREKLFGQDDHVRKYGLDYIDRLEKAGFEVETEFLDRLSPLDKVKHALDVNDILFVVNKV